MTHLAIARPAEGHPMLEKMSRLAKELSVVIPVSFYEEAGNCRFNSIMIIDADGRQLGIYRKTHIPDDPGYYEKFYFSPGDLGFKVWDTAYAKIGVGICWDQWFPEAARAMALKGAEFLLYPTAIGTFAVPPEQVEHEMLDYDHWQNVMLGTRGGQYDTGDSIQQGGSRRNGRDGHQVLGCVFHFGQQRQ